MNDKKVNAIEIKNITKIYGIGSSSVKALKNANLTIYDNEFFTLLGPSGCGKTTLLRLIAGFEDITEGNIKLFSEEIISLPPNKRPVNTVFQHYALFPHLNVYENVAFGPEMCPVRASGVNTAPLSRYAPEARTAFIGLIIFCNSFVSGSVTTI